MLNALARTSIVLWLRRAALPERNLEQQHSAAEESKMKADFTS
jgi:hypothetical protein